MTDKKIAKVTKSYSRKVSLKSISSEYDNITRGTYISSVIGFENEEEFRKKIRYLSRVVMDETEKDIEETFIKLKEMSEDKDRRGLLSLGPSIEMKEIMSNDIEGLEEALANIEDIPEGPVLDLEEVDDLT